MTTHVYIDASNLFYGGEKSLGWRKKSIVINSERHPRRMPFMCSGSIIV